MLRGNLIRLLFIAVLHIAIGRRLAESSSLHCFDLSRRFRRFLFIIDVDAPVIGVAAIIWQFVVYATIIFALVGFLIFDSNNLVRIISLIAIAEWLFIAVPLIIYTAISAVVIRRKFK